ncbi:toxin secretion/phage lysis holin [Bacillus tianshenii]|uniref:Toxin secretion/phage lysis holin n=1 Tax=Sutcliffiella tianshenii TaxID=1463404 RepID=A0ABS2P3Z5_9BACI|nr:phage holin family protein [Bacillus tianshenii]MBM7621428.1 toxin secretion/phage lysis holin [Bacillus tianshenii]
MDKYIIIYFGAVSLTGSIASLLFGGLSKLLFFLIAFVIVDYITGVFAAIVEKKLSSRVGFKGIAQKVFIFALVSIAHVLDIILSTTIIKDITILFYLVNEFISIMENAHRIGVPIPEILKRMIDTVKKKSGL